MGACRDRAVHWPYGAAAVEVGGDKSELRGERSGAFVDAMPCGGDGALVPGGDRVARADVVGAAEGEEDLADARDRGFAGVGLGLDFRRRARRRPGCRRLKARCGRARRARLDPARRTRIDRAVQGRPGVDGALEGLAGQNVARDRAAHPLWRPVVRPAGVGDGMARDARRFSRRLPGHRGGGGRAGRAQRKQGCGREGEKAGGQSLGCSHGCPNRWKAVRHQVVAAVMGMKLRQIDELVKYLVNSCHNVHPRSWRPCPATPVDANPATSGKLGLLR